MNLPLLFFLLICLILASAFFSGAEITYAQASKPRLLTEAEEGDGRAARAVRIMNDYVHAIATILIGNNLVNIAATSIITLLCVNHYFAGSDRATLYAELAATLILLIFGEITPKIICAENCNRLALSFSAPLSAAMVIFKPVVFVVSAFVNKLSSLWVPKEEAPAMTDEELSLVVDSIQEEGVFTEAEGELIKSAIEFGEVTAHDILIPRVEVAAYDIDEPLETLLSDEEAMSYSRLPVYRESIDHIIGILPVKQLIKVLLTAPRREDVSVEKLLVEPHFVHMTKNIDEILRELREAKTNMAVVLDEYGGTMGILTTEDILEEIVGEIYDETDEVEAEDVTEMADGTYLLEGSLNLEDLFEELDYRPKDFESEYTTLSGWITELLDHFPVEGDEFSFERITGRVISTDGPLVEQASITLLPDEEEE